MSRSASLSFKLYHFISAIILVSLIISMTACGGKKSVKKNTISNFSQPDWILNTPIENGFLYGAGSAEIFGRDETGAAARAKDMARVELVKQIEVNVSGEIEQEIKETLSNGETTLTKKLRQAVKSKVPEFKLTNIKAVESHKDKKRVSVLVRLDVTKELQTLTQQVSQLDIQIEEYQKKFNDTNPEGLSAIRMVSPVLILVDQRGELQSRYNALAQKKSALLPRELREFIAKLYDRIAQMTVAIDAEGSENDSIKTGLIASLTKNGIRISDTGISDLLIVYKLDVNNVKRDGSYFAFTNGDVWIKDEKGRVIKSFQAKAKGVSSDAAEALSRSVKKLSNQLGQEMMKALF